MSTKHILKNTETEAVIKCYVTDTAGGNVDISLQNDLTKTTQQYVTPTSIPVETGGQYFDYTGSHVFITGIWWGLKHNKHLDITRIVNPDTPVLHSHYYLVNAGFYDYTSFADRIYANKDLRLIFDGPGHCIIRLRKTGWDPKIETAQFGPYDDVTQVGS